MAGEQHAEALPRALHLRLLARGDGGPERPDQLGEQRLGFSRTVVSEIEAPIILVNLV